MTDEPKHYVLFSALYPPHLGGIENYTRCLANALVSRGNLVSVVTNETSGASAGYCREEGVDVYRLPCFSLISGRLPIARRNVQYESIMREVGERPCDGVLVNARFYPHSIEGMRFARRKGLTPIVLDHSSGYLSFYNPALDVFARTYERFITGIGKRYRPAYYGVSSRCVEWLGSFGIAANGVLSNSIDASEYCQLSSGRDFRGELGFEPEALVVSFVGRLLPDKGVPALLEASQVKEVRERNIEIVVAGDGPLRDQISTLQLGNVSYVGRLSREDTSALLQQTDIMCLPTTYPEGFPTTLLEAAACGCISVVTDVGGARDLIPDDAYGRVIPSGSSDDVAKALVDLEDRREAIPSMGERCRRRVEELFSWDATARAFEKACREAAEAC